MPIEESEGPRDIRQYEDALAVIQREVVTNFMAKAKDGSLLTPHYIVIIEALRMAIAIRSRSP